MMTPRAVFRNTKWHQMGRCSYEFGFFSNTSFKENVDQSFSWTEVGSTSIRALVPYKFVEYIILCCDDAIHSISLGVGVYSLFESVV